MSHHYGSSVLIPGHYGSSGVGQSWYVNILSLSLRGSSSKRRAESFCQSGHSIRRRSQRFETKSGEFKTCFSRLPELGCFKVSAGQERATLQYLSQRGRERIPGEVTSQRKGKCCQERSISNKVAEVNPSSLKIKHSKMSL